MSSTAIAFIATIIAGLATGVGSAIALLAKRPTSRFISISLGFSAGVMIFVSLAELFTDSVRQLTELYGHRGGYWAAIVAFFGGMGLIFAIDKFVPTAVNPHEARAIEAAASEAADSRACPEKGVDARSARLLRTGALTAIVVTIHNFPEGIASLLSGIQSPKLGLAIAFAIAIHNIPEGIAISVPVYYSTGSRKKAFWYSAASGLAEPLGAAIGYLFLRPYLDGPVLGFALAAVAGIMIYISLDELLPSAREFGEHHLAMGGLFTGMLVMALSLAITA